MSSSLLMELHDVLKASYTDRNKRDKELNKFGYTYDSMLSDKNNAIYYNPTEGKVLETVRGTNPFSPKDIGTDIYLAFGHLKDTDRYKDAKKVLESAKHKYGDSVKYTVAGHSLGGTISQGIASNNDDVYAVNAGYTIGQKTKSGSNDNHKHFRTSGDIISAMGGNATHMKTLTNRSGGLISNIAKSTLLGSINPLLGIAHGIGHALSSHNVDTIKGSKIKI